MTTVLGRALGTALGRPVGDALEMLPDSEEPEAQVLEMPTLGVTASLPAPSVQE